jgi:hypothetical protein
MTRKISIVIGRVAAGLAALSMVAASGAASADPRGRYDHRRHDGGGKTEAAIVAGVLGLALGAAISSNNGRNDRYDDRYDGRYARPAPRGYGYGYGYAPPPPPPRYYGRDYRSDCWTTRDYDRRSGVVYERTVCR